MGTASLIYRCIKTTFSALCGKRRRFWVVCTMSIGTYDFTHGKDDECLRSCWYCP